MNETEQKMTSKTHNSVTFPLLLGVTITTAALAMYGMAELAITLSSTQQYRTIALTSTDSSTLGVTTERIQTGEIAQPGQELINALQRTVDEGAETWRTDPLLVTLVEAPTFGFTTITSESLERINPQKSSDTAYIRITQDNLHYLLTLTQPATKGAGGIWIPVELVREDTHS